MADVGLAIGGVRARVTTDDAAVVDALRTRYPQFLAAGGADWTLRIDVAPAVAGPAGGVVVTRDGAPDAFDVSRYDFRGHVDLGRRTAEIDVAEADELTLDSLLRVLLSLALLGERGMVVHAASLVRHGRGYLFPGVSGAGKTTLARLSPGATLLSDELSIVTLGPEGPLLHGTPFWGELGRGGEPRSAPLTAIHFPRHAPRHAATALSERVALSRLLATVMCFAREPDVVARVVDLAADLVARVPCFVLDFRRDPGFWAVVERG